MDLDERDGDDVRVVVGCRDGTVRTWALNSGEEPVCAVDTKSLETREAGLGCDDEEMEEEEEEKEGQLEDSLRYNFDRVTTVEFLPRNEDDLPGGCRPVAVGYESGLLRVVVVRKEGDGLAVVKEQSDLVVAVGAGEGEGIASVTSCGWGDDFNAIDDHQGEGGFLDWLETSDDGKAWGARGDMFSVSSHAGMVVTTARGEAFRVVYTPSSKLAVVGRLSGLPPMSSVTALAVGVLRQDGVCKKSLLAATDGNYAAFYGTSPPSSKEVRDDRPLDLVEMSGRGGWADVDVHSQGKLLLSCDSSSGEVSLWKVGLNSRLCPLARQDFAGDCDGVGKLEGFRATAIAFTKVGENDFCVVASADSSDVVICRVKESKSEEDNSMETDQQEEEEGEGEEFKILVKLRRETTRGPVSKVRASERGDLFACHHSGGGVSVWSSKGLELRFVPCPGGERSSASAHAAFGLDTFLLVTDGGSKLLAYNVFRSVQVSRLVGHRGAVTSVASAPSPFPGSLSCYSGARDGTLRVCDLDSAPAEGEDSPALAEGIVSVSSLASSDKELVVAVASDGGISVASVGQQRCKVLYKSSLPLNPMLFSNAGDRERIERISEAAAEWCDEKEGSILVFTVTSRNRLHVHKVALTEGKEKREEPEIVHQQPLPLKAFSLSAWRVKTDWRKVALSVGLFSVGTDPQVLQAKYFEFNTQAAGEAPNKFVTKQTTEVLKSNATSVVPAVAKLMEGNPKPASFHGCALPFSAADKNCSVWFSAAASTMGDVFVGDTDGRVMVLPSDGDYPLSFPAHPPGSAVAAMAVAAPTLGGTTDLLLTASSSGPDCSVKAWALGLKKEPVQVGEFPLRLAATSMSAAPSGGGGLAVAVGDSAGGVHLLRLEGSMLEKKRNKPEEVPVKKRKTR